MAELVVKEKPDVTVFQEFEGETPVLRRPVLQPAVAAQCFQHVGSLIPGDSGASAGSYAGAAITYNYPDLLAGALVDDLSSSHVDEPNLLDEVVVEVEDSIDTFDVSDDDQTVVASAGVTLGKALKTFKLLVSGTVVTTEAGETRLTFPSTLNLRALGVQVGDVIEFATLAADVIDPASTAISAEIDTATGLPQQFNIIGLPALNAVDVAILGESWDGFIGETNVQVEVRRYPGGEGVVVAPHEDGTGADIAASTTFSIVNSAIDFLADPVQPGDFLRLTDDYANIVGDAAIVIDNVEVVVTPAPTTLPPTTGAPVTEPPDVIQGTGILGIGVPLNAGKIFTDLDATFVADGVVADQDFLRAISDEDDLNGVNGIVTVRNLTDLQIIEVISETQLRLANSLVTESPGAAKSFQYNVVKKNQPVALATNLLDIKILAVLGANSLLLEAAPAVEARTDSREFEFAIIRTQVVNGPVLISYRALRTDLAGQTVEVQAGTDSDMTFLVSRLGPILSTNPLALMAALAATQTTESISAVAVSHWTLEDVGVALDALASQESIYGIAMGTQDATFLSLLQAHVEKFSNPINRNGLERYMVGSWRFPRQSVIVPTVTGASNALAVQAQRNRVVVPSGADWDATDALPNYVIDFDPDGTGRTVAFDVGGAKVLRSSVKITAVIGTDTLQLLETVHADEGGSISGPYEVLTQVRELSENAQRIAEFNNSIGDRRVVSIFPADIKTNVDGTEETLPAYYAAAGIVGRRSATTPSLPLTNRAIAGLSGTSGGQGIYSNEHFDQMAGGGTWILFQETWPDGPVITRHQLTTDISSVQRSEDSIRTAVDYAAKYFRTQMRPLIGKVNITDDFIAHELRPRAEALLETLIGDDIIDKASSLILVERSQVEATTVVITARIASLKPFNYLDITFVIN
jgi:hypothetical protein